MENWISLMKQGLCFDPRIFRGKKQTLKSSENQDSYRKLFFRSSEKQIKEKRLRSANTKCLHSCISQKKKFSSYLWSSDQSFRASQNYYFKCKHNVVCRKIPDLGSHMNSAFTSLRKEFSAELCIYTYSYMTLKPQYIESAALIWLILVIRLVYLRWVFKTVLLSQARCHRSCWGGCYPSF